MTAALTVRCALHAVYVLASTTRFASVLTGTAVHGAARCRAARRGGFEPGLFGLLRWRSSSPGVHSRLLHSPVLVISRSTLALACCVYRCIARSNYRVRLSRQNEPRCICLHCFVPVVPDVAVSHHLRNLLKRYHAPLAVARLGGAATLHLATAMRSVLLTCKLLGTFASLLKLRSDHTRNLIPKPV